MFAAQKNATNFQFVKNDNAGCRVFFLLYGDTTPCKNLIHLNRPSDELLALIIIIILFFLLDVNRRG